MAEKTRYSDEELQEFKELTALGFEIKDTKDGATWKLNK